MTAVELLEEKYKYGYPILEKFSKFSKIELIGKLKDIVGKEGEEILNNNPTLKTTLVDGLVESITLSFYDTIVIDSMGISIKGSHGKGEKIIDFYETFKKYETITNL